LFGGQHKRHLHYNSICSIAEWHELSIICMVRERC
jgi:hypothetical protein